MLFAPQDTWDLCQHPITMGVHGIENICLFSSPHHSSSLWVISQCVLKIISRRQDSFSGKRQNLIHQHCIRVLDTFRDTHFKTSYQVSARLDTTRSKNYFIFFLWFGCLPKFHPFLKDDGREVKGVQGSSGFFSQKITNLNFPTI